jgi:hypothetical protein
MLFTSKRLLLGMTELIMSRHCFLTNTKASNVLILHNLGYSVTDDMVRGEVLTRLSTVDSSVLGRIVWDKYRGRKLWVVCGCSLEGYSGDSLKNRRGRCC